MPCYQCPLFVSYISYRGNLQWMGEFYVWKKNKKSKYNDPKGARFLKKIRFKNIAKVNKSSCCLFNCLTYFV